MAQKSIHNTLKDSVSETDILAMADAAVNFGNNFDAANSFLRQISAVTDAIAREAKLHDPAGDALQLAHVLQQLCADALELMPDDESENSRGMQVALHLRAEGARNHG